MYCNGEGKGNLVSYKAGDRIGMVLDLEEKKMCYFKNGEKTSGDGYTIPEEVHLLVCFGGSNQIVTINNDPEVPEAA
jgi:hypothetical protein